MIGNRDGVAASGNGSRILANISADGVNTVTVDSIDNIRIGQKIDIVNKTTGAVLAADRSVDAITSAGVVTYSGADVAATPGTHVLAFTGLDPRVLDRSNVNGGEGPREGDVSRHTMSIEAMRARLKAISAANYTDARLNAMTMNDMVYAIRLADRPDSIKDL